MPGYDPDWDNANARAGSLIVLLLGPLGPLATMRLIMVWCSATGSVTLSSDGLEAHSSAEDRASATGSAGSVLSCSWETPVMVAAALVSSLKTRAFSAKRKLAGGES